jgi:hypothetical protein
MKGQAEEGAIITNYMAKAGVPILAGCDGMISGYCLHDELAMFVREECLLWRRFKQRL